MLNTAARQRRVARRTIKKIPESNRRVHTATIPGCSTRFSLLHCPDRRAFTPSLHRSSSRAMAGCCANKHTDETPKTPNKYANRRLVHQGSDAPSPHVRSARTSERRRAACMGLYHALRPSSYSWGLLTTFRADCIAKVGPAAMMYRLRKLQLPRKNQISHGAIP